MSLFRVFYLPSTLPPGLPPFWSELPVIGVPPLGHTTKEEAPSAQGIFKVQVCQGGRTPGI